MQFFYNIFLLVSFSIIGFYTGKIFKSFMIIIKQSKKLLPISATSIFLLTPFSYATYIGLYYSNDCEGLQDFIKTYNIETFKEGYERLVILYKYDYERAKKQIIFDFIPSNITDISPYNFSKFQEKDFKGVCRDFSSAMICLAKHFKKEIWVAVNEFNAIISKKPPHALVFTRHGDEFRAYDQQFDYTFERIDDIKNLGYFIVKMN